MKLTNKNLIMIGISCITIAILIGGFTFFFLTDYGDTLKIKSAIKERLRDPESARFEDVIMNHYANTCCILYNAKNSMGGYGDQSCCKLKRNGSEWIIIDMSVSENEFALECQSDKEVERYKEFNELAEKYIKSLEKGER